MYSTFLALETARRALSAHQKAMEVVGHNIANAANPGYVRREAILEATPPYVAAQVHLLRGQAQSEQGLKSQR